MHSPDGRPGNLCWLSKKRSRNPQLQAFGAALAEMRGGSSREQISIKLANLGVPLGGSTLAQYEKGTVWAPDPGVLWGLATIYKEPLELLVAMLTTNRSDPTLQSFEGRDLIRHARTGQQAPHLKGGADVPAEARVRELQGRIEDYERTLTDIRKVAGKLLTIAARGEKTRTAARTETGNRRRDRKVG